MLVLIAGISGIDGTLDMFLCIQRYIYIFPCSTILHPTPHTMYVKHHTYTRTGSANKNEPATAKIMSVFMRCDTRKFAASACTEMRWVCLALYDRHLGGTNVSTNYILQGHIKYISAIIVTTECVQATIIVVSKHA